MLTSRPSSKLLPITCLGEAIVDLICERNLEPGESPTDYVPWSGGALANVSVAIARAEFSAALLGGVGSDEWGTRLREDLSREGVLVDWLTTVEGADTPVALVEFDTDNEPSFNVYGEAIGPTMEAAATRLTAAISGSQALIIGSNTMVGEPERVVTRRAVDLASNSSLPILFDPNYRLNRWTGPEPARMYCQELAARSSVVKLNRGEARLMTGEADPLRAARALVATGPELVVVTDGSGEIVTSGAAEVSFQPTPVLPVSPLGAGDAFMGALAAKLGELDWDLGRVEEVLPQAAQSAADSCLKWGAW